MAEFPDRPNISGFNVRTKLLKYIRDEMCSGIFIKSMTHYSISFANDIYFLTSEHQSSTGVKFQYVCYIEMQVQKSVYLVENNFLICLNCWNTNKQLLLPILRYATITIDIDHFHRLTEVTLIVTTSLLNKFSWLLIVSESE